MEISEDFIDAREVYETELMERGMCPECEGTGSVIGTELPDAGWSANCVTLEPCDTCKFTGEYKKQ